MDKDHLSLLEDQNPVRRSEIFAGSGSAKVALTEAIKSLSNVSGREADVCVALCTKNEYANLKWEFIAHREAALEIIQCDFHLLIFQ
ncbi:hypothetical protein A8C28_27205 [Klebsiella pneumoniae]|uniref:hypothetical protein n=1 Tax=Enterobacterales TaxID=91347 RepID=UPI00164B35B9|nr:MULTISPECIES: hypothetical protein [Klebsiella]EIW9109612.1 hypothetical protein [Klebsiella pneumoniae]MBC5200855.1 hypothetical protein [Klebsiella pneumoniae]MCK5967250.1 hypothetical protein [Klebsiella pneumoniae]MCQ0603194.1 hypothetical protein [Klebsiella pneumoniae]MCQ8404303.1 hypothetical protein [Klebsiella pneumoniae]